MDERRLVHISTVTRLEIGFSFRTGHVARRETASPPLSLLPVAYLTPATEDRAVEVQLLLSDRGQHRAPSIPDLLIAATAEKAGLVVLAVDKDFHLIAEITGQAVGTLRLNGGDGVDDPVPSSTHQTSTKSSRSPTTKTSPTSPAPASR